MKQYQVAAADGGRDVGLAEFLVEYRRDKNECISPLGPVRHPDLAHL
jgi:hypothetical protein